MCRTREQIRNELQQSGDLPAVYLRPIDLAGFVFDDLADPIVFLDTPETEDQDGMSHSVTIHREGKAMLVFEVTRIFEYDEAWLDTAKRYSAALQFIIDTVQMDGTTFRSYEPTLSKSEAVLTYGILIPGEGSLLVSYAQVLDCDAVIWRHVEETSHSPEIYRLLAEAQRGRDMIIKPTEYLSLPQEALANNLDALNRALSSGATIITGIFKNGAVKVQLIARRDDAWDVRLWDFHEHISTEEPIGREYIKPWLDIRNAPVEVFTWYTKEPEDPLLRP